MFSIYPLVPVDKRTISPLAHPILNPVTAGVVPCSLFSARRVLFHHSHIAFWSTCTLLELDDCISRRVAFVEKCFGYGFLDIHFFSSTAV